MKKFYFYRVDFDIKNVENITIFIIVWHIMLMMPVMLQNFIGTLLTIIHVCFI